MRRKPAALRNIGIYLDGRALSRFERGHPVELVHGDCHAYLSEFAFDGSELVYCDPPYLRAQVVAPLPARLRGRRPRGALLGLLAGLPCAVMVSGYPSALYDELLDRVPRQSG